MPEMALRHVLVRAQHVGGAVIWRRQKPPLPAKVLPFKGTLLEQGQQQAGELAAKVTTDGQRVDGEVSVTAQGQSWAAKVWARVTGQRQAKPDVSAGVEVSKRW
jgi:hypothetical protein